MMNQYIIGEMIKTIRKQNNMTQADLAKQLSVSDKTISKWERGKGYPDISLLEPLSKALGISVNELLSGYTITHMNVSSNMMRSMFYICPICGNIIHTMKVASISCHGELLSPSTLKEEDEEHNLSIEKIEDEYYVTLKHPMDKTHYISFIAALSYDRITIVKLYPESDVQVRFKVNGVKKIIYCCHKDGLFYKLIKKDK